MTSKSIVMFIAGFIGMSFILNGEYLIGSSIIGAAFILDYTLIKEAKAREQQAHHDRKRIEILEKRLNHLLKK